MDHKKKTLHANMVNEISHHIDPILEKGKPWKAFMNQLDFSPVERDECKDVFDVFSNLLMKGRIQIGEYTIVRKSLKSNSNVCSIIDKYVNKMKGRIKSATSKKDTPIESDDDESTEDDNNKDNSDDGGDESDSSDDIEDKSKQGPRNTKVTQKGSNININISGARVKVRDVGKQEVNYKTGKRRGSSEDGRSNKKKRKS